MLIAMVKARPSPTDHVFLFLFAIMFAIGSVFWIRAQSLTVKRGDNVDIGIGLEVKEQSTVRLAMSAGTAKGIAEFTADDNWLAVHVPSTWTVREVRGGEMKDITSRSSISENFSRWSIPPKATLSFWVPLQPTRLLIRNATSNQAIRLLFTDANVRTSAVRSENYLIKNQPVVIDRAADEL